MRYILANLPIYATATFEIPEPEGWGLMSKIERIQYFYDNCENTVGSLCRYCKDNVNTDMIINYEALSTYPELVFEIMGEL